MASSLMVRLSKLVVKRGGGSCTVRVVSKIFACLLFRGYRPGHRRSSGSRGSSSSKQVYTATTTTTTTLTTPKAKTNQHQQNHHYPHQSPHRKTQHSRRSTNTITTQRGGGKPKLPEIPSAFEDTWCHRHCRWPVEDNTHGGPIWTSSARSYGSSEPSRLCAMC